MRITACYAQDIAPLNLLTQDSLLTLPLTEADGAPVDRVALTGVSGTGKSTVLQGIAMAWAGLKDALTNERPQIDGCFAMRVEGLVDTPLLVVRAASKDFLQALTEAGAGERMTGWAGGERVGTEALEAIRLADARGALPNMLWLDEDAKDMQARDMAPWLVTSASRPLRDADGMEQALCDMATHRQEEYELLIRTANRLLRGKKIERTGTAHRVALTGGGEHALARLSHGERRMFFLLYTVVKELMPQGVLLVDEPDMNLHPAQVIGVMATLEHCVAYKHAQVILTTHTPAVWQRYEALGINVRLEEKA